MPNSEPRRVGRQSFYDSFADPDWNDLRPPHRDPQEKWPTRVWASVVANAVDDSECKINGFEYRDAKHYKEMKRQLRDDAIRWLLSPHLHTGSFRWICRATGADWQAAVEAQVTRLRKRWGSELLDRLRVP